ncbi:MAG: transporter substrate-binding domain-containing protein [Dysgonamonadaceae bacterium]|jgi:membrane-bound lytic murein transglycosylase F|nr:transporter substrate-binding domain-containing protein [Dysgonamonadaceae bacterium]
MECKGLKIKLPQSSRTGKKLQIAALSCLALLLMAGGYFCREKLKTGRSGDFQQIIDKKELNVITLPGSMTCFTYKGEIRGYEYELLNDFAESYNLRINLKMADNETQPAEWLKNGEGDLIACNIPITGEGKKHLIYCGREVVNEQVLIQRANRKDTILKDVVDLIGKEVTLIRGSKYHRRMVNLNNELGGGIRIRTIDGNAASTEDLIEMVAQGKIPYTVSDMDLAKLSKNYFGNINISVVTGHPQRSSWAVRKSMPELAEAINRWAKENRNSPKPAQINKRYFEISKNDTAWNSIWSEDRISPFDGLFKKYALRYGFDWQLLASISFRESNFLPNRSSREGATGLMGLMPRTGRALGVPDDKLYDPEQNIKAACKLLVKSGKYFTAVKDKEERMKFILGSYNAGQAHIADAQRLALKYGKNPNRWEDVKTYLLLKSRREYYSDPVCKAGYLRGKETVNYVTDVTERWKYYLHGKLTTDN